MEKRCSECPEPRLAQSLCTYCNKWLCYQCTDMHQHQRAPSQCPDLHPLPRTPSITQCPGPDLHPRVPSSLPPPDPGEHLSLLGPCPGSLLMCHSHRQEPLELFCESCDLLCCSSCHLSSHKNHRLVHVGKALQDQQWLFESLVAQVDEKRSAVESTAKQIEDRLHSVKITQRKAENQIKMAKMIMMNELNKRANLLIEQLEKISEDFQRRLEDQLQGAIEMCSQLDHVQNFVTWATAHHRRNPLLFSRELISLQMQRLLEPTHHPDSWVPVKIKFNWDASYWTKQMSSLGQLTVEGGNRTYSEGVACPSILRPQPITCMALPPVCRSGRDQGCAYQACYQPQMCCLHCLPSQPALQPEKAQRGPNPYPARCAQSTLSSPPLLQRCWGPQSPPSTLPSSLQCPPPPAPSPPLALEPTVQLSSSSVSPVQSPSTVSQSNSPQPLTEHPPDIQPHAQTQAQTRIQTQAKTQAKTKANVQAQAHIQTQAKTQAKTKANAQAQAHVQTQAKTQPAAEGSRAGQSERSSRALPHKLPAGGDRELLAEEAQEESREQTAGLPELGREVLSEGLQLERRDQQRVQAPPVAELREGQQAGQQAGQQETWPPQQPRNYRHCLERDGKRSTSLETSVLMAHGHDANAQNRPGFSPSPSPSPSTSPCPSPSPSLRSACGKRKSRSQSTPADLAARYGTSSTDGPTGATHGPGTATADRARLSDQYGCVDARERRVLDGVIRSVGKETCLATPLSRGQPPLRLSPLTSYKTEPDNMYVYATEETGYEVKEKYRISRKSQDSRVEKETPRHAGTPKVPVVCLERLKVLVSRLPPQGRRQSDPLPASGLDRTEASLAQRAWRDGMAEGISKGSASTRATLSLITPPYTQSHAPSQSPSPPEATTSRGKDRHSPGPEPPLSALTTEPEHVPQLCPSADLDTDSEPRSISDPEADSEPDPESDPQPESSSEADLESMAGEELEAAGGSEAGADSEGAGGSEPSGESELDPEVESYDDAESDLQPDPDPAFQSLEPRPESESDMESDQLPESQGSAESGPDLESDPEPVAAGQTPQCSEPGPEGNGEVQTPADTTEMESEDFCAVCLIGGDLLCCDRCPKVFHLTCHVPSLLSFPTGDWVCTLCRDDLHPEVEYDCPNQRLAGETAGRAGLLSGLSESEQRKCEKLTLLIFSNILSAPFQEPVSPLARHYYQIIKRPMDLSVIRAKLNKTNTRHYYSPEEFVADVALMFMNCAKFNYPDSEVAQAGRSLESFFSAKLREVFPDKAFPVAVDDSDSDEYDEVARMADNGFPWPERREQGHRKRKRRHSLNWRRHHF